MSSENKEKKKLVEMEDSYILVKKEDSGMRLKTQVQGDENSGARAKSEPTKEKQSESK